jgi:hypothetical protein
VDPTDPPVPELQTMPLGLHDVVQFAILGAGFALLAYFLYSLTSRDEVSARYRPSAYAVPVFADVTPAWFTAMQVGYSAADVVAKVGFGVLVHKVAKLRTAEDVAAGVDTHPEPVWSSNVHKSDGVLPEVGRVAPAVLDRLGVSPGREVLRRSDAAPGPAGRHRED